MSSYIQRVKENCSAQRLVLWWIFRIIMLGAFVFSLFDSSHSITVSLSLGGAFVGSFLWEIGMAMKEGSVFRLLPSSLQSIVTALLFASAYGGNFMNMNYELWIFSPVLHFLAGAAMVFIGYEFACALAIRDKHGITKAMAFFLAFGITFIAMNVWELSEFFIDQLQGYFTGTAGNLQHWSYALAEGTSSIKSFIDPVVIERWPIMDTMGDIVISTIGAFAALLVVNIYPYRHKGKYKYFMSFDGEEPVAAVLPKSVGKPLEIYFNRLKDNCPARTYLLWWIIRGFMIALLIKTIVSDEYTGYESFQVIANMCCMFIWELVMAMPRKNVFRYIPPILQTVITVCDFIAVYAGLVLNFYYEVRLWDSFMHLFSGFVGVYFGYEIVYALIKMEKKTASPAVILLCAAGCCFMLETFWEIFEFGYDHIRGLMSGYPGDAQHWSALLAEGTAKEKTLFEFFDPGRWPLMDTMGDMVLNTIGITTATLTLKLRPYRLKGKSKYVFDFDKKNEYAA